MKFSTKMIISIAVLIIIILCCSFIFMQQATLKSEIDSELGGHQIAGEGTDFKIKANVTHQNMFGAILIDGEELNVTVKDDAGKVVNKMTVKEEEWHELGNLSVGHYTLELSYVGDFPGANLTKDFTVISAEDYARKA